MTRDYGFSFLALYIHLSIFSLSFRSFLCHPPCSCPSHSLKPFSYLFFSFQAVAALLLLRLGSPTAQLFLLLLFHGHFCIEPRFSFLPVTVSVHTSASRQESTTQEKAFILALTSHHQERPRGGREALSLSSDSPNKLKSLFIYTVREVVVFTN